MKNSQEDMSRSLAMARHQSVPEYVLGGGELPLQ